MLAEKDVLKGEGALWVRTTKVETCTGECYVNRRKGKIIPGYELAVTIGWSGEARGEDGQKVYGAAQGYFSIPYLGDENADEDADVKVAVRDGGGAVGDRIREALLKPGIALVRKELRTFVADLAKGGPAAEGATSGSSAPSATSTKTSGASTTTAAAAAKKKDTQPKPAKKKEEKGRTIKITQNFYCRPMDIFESLMDDRRVKVRIAPCVDYTQTCPSDSKWCTRDLCMFVRIWCWHIEKIIILHRLTCRVDNDDDDLLQAFTQSDASISREVGGAFSLFSGNIVGKNKEIVPGVKIVQDWRFSNWVDDVYSTVTITFTEAEKGNTTVSLVQTGVPDEDRFGNSTVYEQTERGWRENIFHRIRTTFGFGV